MKVHDVANYFIHRSQQEGEDGLITNLKLQKLCYYAQGFYLAINHGTPLFEENIEAWKHGPVVRNLYAALAENGSNPVRTLIEPADGMNKMPTEIKSFLDDIYNELGQFSAWALREMTHKEDPWLKNWGDGKLAGKEIPHTDLISFFATKLV